MREVENKTKSMEKTKIKEGLIKSHEDLVVYQMAFEAAFIAKLNECESEAAETQVCC